MCLIPAQAARAVDDNPGSTINENTVKGSYLCRMDPGHMSEPGQQIQA